jgi:hypothetical protein
VLRYAVTLQVCIHPNRNEYQEYFLGGKGGRCVGLTTYHLHVPTVLKSGSLNLLEPSGPVHACFICYLYYSSKPISIRHYAGGYSLSCLARNAASPIDTRQLACTRCVKMDAEHLLGLGYYAHMWFKYTYQTQWEAVHKPPGASYSLRITSLNPNCIK